MFQYMYLWPGYHLLNLYIPISTYLFRRNDMRTSLCKYLLVMPIMHLYHLSIYFAKFNKSFRYLKKYKTCKPQNGWIGNFLFSPSDYICGEFYPFQSYLDKFLYISKGQNLSQIIGFINYTKEEDTN